jgi:hypothetical protein
MVDTALRPTPTAAPTATGIPCGNATSAQPSYQPGQSPEGVVSSIIRVRDPASAASTRTTTIVCRRCTRLHATAVFRGAHARGRLRRSGLAMRLGFEDCGSPREVVRQHDPVYGLDFRPIGRARAYVYRCARRRGQAAARGAGPRRRRKPSRRLWQGGPPNGGPSCSAVSANSPSV